MLNKKNIYSYIIYNNVVNVLNVSNKIYNFIYTILLHINNIQIYLNYIWFLTISKYVYNKISIFLFRKMKLSNNKNVLSDYCCAVAGICAELCQKLWSAFEFTRAD